MMLTRSIISLVICYSVAAVQVTVKQGILEGAQVPLVTGDGSYYSFKGIPYAAKPIGELRFQQPHPAANWSGVRSAHEHGNVCLQIDYILDPTTVIGDEDCLFLNVYTPTLNKSKLPVMVFIHGGGLVFGSGNDNFYGPDFLVQHGVVLVTFNYRLGPFGFLSLGTKKVPGNAGLKDQVAALQWVQENIKQFGGDSNNVTIFGQSGGGVSVSLHMVSPMSAGLFQRAVSMSGTASMEWTIPFEPEERAFAIGRLLGFDTRNKDDLLNFLQNVNGSSLIGLEPSILENEEDTLFVKTTYSTYTVEKNVGGQHFLTEDPIVLLKKRKYNKADFMAGHTNNEFMTLFNPQSLPRSIVRFSTFRELFVPKRIMYNVKPAKALKVADIIEKHYFGDKPVNNDTKINLLNCLNDVGFCYDIYKYLNYLGESAGSGRYLYLFAAVSSRNVFGVSRANTFGLPPAAGHTDDWFYLFDPKLFNMTLPKDSKEYMLVQQFTTLITNFAKYGNPTPFWIQNDKYLGKTIWPNYNPGSRQYLNFSTVGMNIGENLDSAAIKLFDSIYKIADINY